MQVKLKKLISSFIFRGFFRSFTLHAGEGPLEVSGTISNSIRRRFRLKEKLLTFIKRKLKTDTKGFLCGWRDRLLAIIKVLPGWFTFKMFLSSTDSPMPLPPSKELTQLKNIKRCINFLKTRELSSKKDSKIWQILLTLVKAAKNPCYSSLVSLLRTKTESAV